MCQRKSSYTRNIAFQFIRYSYFLAINSTEPGALANSPLIHFWIHIQHYNWSLCERTYTCMEMCCSMNMLCWKSNATRSFNCWVLIEQHLLLVISLFPFLPSLVHIISAWEIDANQDVNFGWEFFVEMLERWCVRGLRGLYIIMYSQ